METNASIMILTTWALGLIASLIIIPQVIKLSKKKKLLDKPNERKEHKTPIPTLGGIGIFIALLIAFAVNYVFYYRIEFHFILVALIILFVTGLRDDLVEISAKKKFLIQILTASIIAYSGTKIVSLFGVFNVFELPNYMQYIVTIFIVVGVTNAVNLLDGIDGLAGGVSLINSLVFTLLFYLEDSGIPYALLGAGMAGGLIGFLRYNLNPAKIFMGDTGSLVIGFVLAFLGMKYIQTATFFKNEDALIIVFGLLILPVFDTIRVFAVRILKGNSPFDPDKNHIHHLLIKTGLNHKRASFIMYLANMILIGVSYLLTLSNLPVLTSFLILAATAIILSELLSLKRAQIIYASIEKLIAKKEEKQSNNYLLDKLNKKNK